MLSTASIVYEFCGTWYGQTTMATTSPKAADLTIIITGKPGTGKTTLVLAFQEFLLLRGFTDVSVLDPDLTPNGGRPRGHNGVRLAALAARDPSVCIAAVMAPKGRPSPQPAPCHEELF